MSNETKRDVFEDALDELLLSKDDGALDADLRRRYAAAPAEVVKVPSGIVAYIKYCKEQKLGIQNAINWHMAPDWVTYHDNLFAAAWTAWPNVEADHGDK